MVVEIRGNHLGPALIGKLEAPDPGRLYTVATTRFAASDQPERLGGIESYAACGLLRDEVEAHLQEHGFPPAS